MNITFLPVPKIPTIAITVALRNQLEFVVEVCCMYVSLDVMLLYKLLYVIYYVLHIHSYQLIKNICCYGSFV